MTTINLAESQNLPIRQTKIRPPGLLRQDTKLAGLIKKPSLRLCGRRHQVSANARIEEKPCQEHQTSQKQNPPRSPRLNFFVLIRVNSWLYFSASISVNLRQIFNQKHSYLPAKIQKIKIFLTAFTVTS
jgi:hypothetical protein